MRKSVDKCKTYVQKVSNKCTKLKKNVYKDKFEKYPRKCGVTHGCRRVRHRYNLIIEVHMLYREHYVESGGGNWRVLC